MTNQERLEAAVLALINKHGNYQDEMDELISAGQYLRKPEPARVGYVRDFHLTPPWDTTFKAIDLSHPLVKRLVDSGCALDKEKLRDIGYSNTDMEVLLTLCREAVKGLVK